MDGRTDGRADGRTDEQGKNIWPSDYRQAGHKKRKEVSIFLMLTLDYQPDGLQYDVPK